MLDNKNSIAVDNKKFPEGIDPFSWYSIIATWFFTGRFFIMPGTLGSLAVYPIYYYLWTYVPASHLLFTLYTITILIFLTGFIAVSKFQEVGRVTDHRAIVIDEVIGMLVTLCISISYLLPNRKYYSQLFGVPPIAATFLAAFVLFRFFDIFKVFGIKFIDKKFKGPFGVILDDVIAGIYAGLTIIILNKIIK